MGKTLADLQSNISISAENAATGDIEFCSGYTGFSDDASEQSGWYLALKVSPSVGGTALEGATITATYGGTVRTLADGETFIIRLAEGEDSITFAANKEGYTEGRLTLDLSGLTLKPVPVDPKTLPQIKLSDITYNNVDYTISDFMSVQGIIERSDDSASVAERKSMVIVKNATFKRVSLNGGQTYGYYLPFTANTESEMEHNGSYYPVQYVNSKGEGGTVNIQTSNVGARPSLLEIADVWATNSSNIQYVEGKLGIKISTNVNAKPRIIAFENCIFENKPAIDPTGNVCLKYSDITYGGVNYQASDFVVGGTISKNPNNTELIISNATFKWNPLQGETTNAYYLPIINTGDGWLNCIPTGSFSSSTAIGQVPVISVKTRGTSGDLIKFVEGTGNNPCMIKINNTTARMRGGCLNINGSQVFLTLSNCTFEPAPT